MKLSPLSIVLFLFVSSFIYAQNIKKEILFTIDNKPYYTDEFFRIYKKNLDLVKDDSQKDLNQYLSLFVDYKLKINKAYKLQLDKNPQYKTEFESYRSQLSKNYLTDQKITQQLINEAYNRLQKEIKASHILLTLAENASPEDTLKVYNQILDIRKKALSDEDFGALAVSYSQDPSAKENKGDLGYFSALRMVYPFENGAYNTPKGGISMPVRTRFGYHLINVTDIRDNRGDIIAAHIMILKPTDTTQADQSKSKIETIYAKLQQGESFEALAQQFSEDKSTSGKGGVLNRFSSGQLGSAAFENVAFSLSPENPVSAPFKSEYGWHIVKLIEKFPVKPLQELQPDLESKIEKDDRSRVIAASMNQQLRKRFPVKKNKKEYSSVVESLNKEYVAGNWNIPDTNNYKKPVLTIKNNPIAATEFLTYIKNQQNNFKGSTLPLPKIVDNLYEKFVDQELKNYYAANLENEYPEFGAIVEEYRDGLLLFDLMEKEIWQKSKTDSIGLQNFYTTNKNKYQWAKRVDAVVMSSINEDIIKKAAQLLKQNKSAEEIKAQLNVDKKGLILEKQGVFEENSGILPKNITLVKGVTDIIQEGDYFFVVKIDKVLPAGEKTFEECKGRAINDYQNFLEENWVTELRKEFKVQVDQKVFEKIKKQIKI